MIKADPRVGFLHGVWRKKSLANATARKAAGWLAKTTCETVAGPGSSHVKLVGYLVRISLPRRVACRR